MNNEKISKLYYGILFMLWTLLWDKWGKSQVWHILTDEESGTPRLYLCDLRKDNVTSKLCYFFQWISVVLYCQNQSTQCSSISYFCRVDNVELCRLEQFLEKPCQRTFDSDSLILEKCCLTKWLTFSWGLGEFGFRRKN